MYRNKKTSKDDKVIFPTVKLLLWVYENIRYTKDEFSCVQLKQADIHNRKTERFMRVFIQMRFYSAVRPHRPVRMEDNCCTVD